MWLLFMTAMWVTGVVHQSAWLATSDREWVVSSRPRSFERMALYDLAQAYMIVDLEQGDYPQKAWESLPEAMRKYEFSMRDLEFAEYVPVVRQGVVEGVLIVPRNRNPDTDAEVEADRFFYHINKERKFRLEMSQLNAALQAARGEGEMPVGLTDR